MHNFSEVQFCTVTLYCRRVLDLVDSRIFGVSMTLVMTQNEVVTYPMASQLKVENISEQQ